MSSINHHLAMILLELSKLSNDHSKDRANEFIAIHDVEQATDKLRKAYEQRIPPVDMEED